MPRLLVSLLGSFQVSLDGQPVTAFKSDKVRALLAFLAVEADRPHRRELLAGLLWPNIPDQSARSNLRDVLANLRQAIGDRDAAPPFLLVSRETVQFNRAGDCWVDLAAFEELAADPGPRLDKAVALYGGEFLAGFSLADSAAFEEWILVTRERLARQMSAALHRLSALAEQAGDYERAAGWAWRQLEREPWDEQAHQGLMRALALGGQRSAALAQYTDCRRLLAEELGVEPAQETTQLYQRIRNGELGSPAPTLRSLAEPPAFLDQRPAEAERSVFVARERELTYLEAVLKRALAGRGRVLFVTGEAGSGKTALIQEFVERAQAACPSLLVASGNCNAAIGIGDPYLPLREILGLLTGDVQARWAAGAMSSDHARRLWQALPSSIKALVEVGPDLIDTFVPGAALLERAVTRAAGPADWLSDLERLVKRKSGEPIAAGLQQLDLFEQVFRFLQAVARQAPLLLLVDDLQWADAGAISLLFHIGRQSPGSRLLIIGAYRSEEVALGREGERHPLEAVVNQLQIEFGEPAVDLDQAEHRPFVTALLDSEPNRLGEPFRETLYQKTRGHPLFTVELLRGMQERGDLRPDAAGRWVEGPALDWDTLPTRMEAAIAERIGRLAEPLRAALRVASVEGEQFTAEVVARVLRTDDRAMVQQLSRELDRRHQLVRALAIERLPSGRLSRYRFAHNAFQRYLYDSLDPVERAFLHEDVGTILEELYADQAAGIAVQLAHHFRQAGVADKAIRYLHLAGVRALQLSAYQEAVPHLAQGLGLLLTQPDSPARAEQELALQLALGMAWQGLKGTQGPEYVQAYGRARALCQQTGQSAQLCRVLGELSLHHYVRAEQARAREMAQEALSLALGLEDPLLAALCHWYLAVNLFSRGEFTAAQAHLEQVTAFYRPAEHHRPIVLLRGSDFGPSALGYAACCLWCLGYPDQAVEKSRQALALARELDHAFTLADVLCYAGCRFSELLRDTPALKAQADELTQLATDKFPAWLGMGVSLQGVALAMLGRPEAMTRLRAGLETETALGMRCYVSTTLGSLAWAQAVAGAPREGLATLVEALAMVEETNERYREAELHRIQGEIYVILGDDATAKASFERAIAVARRQEAKSWELRAAVSLARLWRRQGRSAEAAATLAPVYGWFAEGFDTPDLQEAGALLAELH